MTLTCPTCLQAGEAHGDNEGGIDPDLELEGGDQVAVGGREVEDLPGQADDQLEGVALSVDTPLKKLRELCDSQGISRSGGKDKVLRRLRLQREKLEYQMTAEVARKMYWLKHRGLPSCRRPASRSYTT